MSDSKDDEIAELKARLARLEGAPKQIPPMPKKKGGLGCLGVVGIVFIGLVIVGAIAGNGHNATSTQSSDQAASSPPAAGGQPASEEATKLTPAQKNAVRSARQYLSMTGFSRDGLIRQLSSTAGDGYDEADATAAVDSIDVDWNENAAKSAKQYLNMSGFSCSGLIHQLSSSAGDKYTVSQATYGAQRAGAC